MNNQAVGRHLPRDTEGIYPFAGLPVRLGFPSCADFQIIHNERGVATEWSRAASFCASAECAGFPDNCCPIAVDRPVSCKPAFTFTIRAFAGCWNTPATRMYFST